MSYRPDIVVMDESGKSVAWVEVKSTRHSDAYEYAGFFEEGAQGAAPRDLRFFMLVTLAEISLWDLSKTTLMEERFGKALATYSMGLPRQLEHLPRYVETRTSGHPTYREMLATIVFQWLIHLRAFGADETDPAEKMLKEKGFIDVLSGARLDLDQAA